MFYIVNVSHGSCLLPTKVDIRPITHVDASMPVWFFYRLYETASCPCDLVIKGEPDRVGEVCIQHVTEDMTQRLRGARSELRNKLHLEYWQDANTLKIDYHNFWYDSCVLENNDYEKQIEFEKIVETVDSDKPVSKEYFTVIKDFDHFNEVEIPQWYVSYENHTHPGPILERERHQQRADQVKQWIKESDGKVIRAYETSNEILDDRDVMGDIRQSLDDIRNQVSRIQQHVGLTD